MQTTLDRLAIALLPGFTPRLGAILLSRREPAEVLAEPDAHKEIPVAARRDIRTGAARARAEREWRRAEREGIRVVGAHEDAYPPWLRQIPDPPLVLFVRGTLVPGEGERAVAVVGSRSATASGLALAGSLARDLARAGLAVVSGLARGIDTAAHRGALEGGGRTIAVLGSGLLRVYPVDNAGLVDRICERGAVVSEFALDASPHKRHFPWRNRVIAGWGRGVVVVEAGEKSGALITARLALDGGREVMAVPGHPFVAAAAGTNDLLRKSGASPVRHAADVLEQLEIDALPTAAADAPEDDVLRTMRRDVPASLEEIAARSGRPVPELLSRLGALELRERVRRLPGPLFVRS